MGLAIFEQSGSFDPTMYGLQAGDLIQVIAVGGGGGGGGGGAGYPDEGYSYYGGDAGKGGYGVVNTTKKRAGRSIECGGAGRGYGAGGGGGGSNGARQNENGCPGSGGNGGRIEMKAIKLESTDAIPVTIGTAGKGGEPNKNGTAGGSTSFGSYLTAEGGAGGKYNDQPDDAPNKGGGVTIGSYNGAGGGGGGGYLPGERIFGGAGGSANNSDSSIFAGSGSGGCSGGAEDSTKQLLVIPEGSSGCLPGMDGGFGSGVVIVTW